MFAIRNAFIKKPWKSTIIFNNKKPTTILNNLRTKSKLSSSSFDLSGRKQNLSSSTNKPNENTYHRVFTFGSGSSGQLGLNDFQDHHSPQPIPFFDEQKTKLVDLALSWTHSIAVTSDKKVFAWGLNDRRQFGVINAGANVPSPRLLELLNYCQIENVSAGRLCSFFLSADTDVYCTGESELGHLGCGQEILSTTLPLRNEQLRGKKVIQMASGLEHCLTLTESGDVLVWGWNESGQLGLGNYESKFEPTLLPFTHGKVVRVFAGHDHSFLLTDDGSLWAFGNNACGQLGVGDVEDRVEPTLVEGFSDKSIGLVASGGTHTLVLTEDGEVWGWGMGKSGELGISIEHSKQKKTEEEKENEDLDFVETPDDWLVIPKPTLIKPFLKKQVKTIVCGGSASYVWTEDKRLFVFGLGDNGRLGLGNSANQTEPQELTFFRDKNVAGIAAGVDHAAIVVEEKLSK